MCVLHMQFTTSDEGSLLRSLLCLSFFPIFQAPIGSTRTEPNVVGEDDGAALGAHINRC